MTYPSLKNRSIALTLWCATVNLAVAQAQAPPAGFPSGVVVEGVAPDSAASAGGLKPGDAILSWSRAAAPANPQPDSGRVDSPFDLVDVGIDQVPRGPVTLTGRRGPEAMSWTLPAGLSHGLSVRPDFPAPLQSLYQEGRDLVGAKKVADGAQRWRAAATEARGGGGRQASVWLLARAGAALAGARMWAESDAAYEEAIQEAQGQLAPAHIAQLHRGWADAFRARSDWASVAERSRRALALDEAEARPESLSLALSLLYVGTTSYERGELAMAEEFLRRAVRMREKWAPGSVQLADVLTNLGAVLRSRRDLGAAGDVYRRVLALRERLQPGSPRIAGSFLNLGIVAQDAGDLAKAEDYLRRALAIGNATEYVVASSLDSLGEVAKARGDLAAAEDHYRRALAVREKIIPGSWEVAENLYHLGNVARERGDLAAAEDHYRRALAIEEKLGSGTVDEAEMLHALGLVQRQTRRTADALASFRRALESLESQRARLGGAEEVRVSFFAKYAPYYHDTMRTLVELGRPDEALLVLERSRARSLLALLAEREVLFRADLSPELARERKLTDAEYDRVQASLAPLDAVRDRTKVDELHVRLRELRAAQQEIATRVRQASPRFAALENPQALDLARVRKALDPGTLFLAYSVGKEGTLLFAVEPQAAPGSGLSVFSLPVGANVLQEKVEAFRRRVQRGQRSDRAALIAQAAGLYDLLLRPAQARLAGSERLLVSPDGPLHSLPFAALVHQRTPAASYLVEWKPLTVVPSGTVHDQLKRARREEASGQGRVVAFGDPRYPAPAKGPAGSAGDAELRSALSSGFALSALPATRDEVEGIAALFPERTQKYLGLEATEDRAKALGGEARYVHFACHATLDERFPLNSAVALTIPEKPRDGEENGLLQAWEIFDRVRIEADLVTLSACSTALGTEMGGEGLLGLRRAFHYAGARSVLASLWAVSDRSTAAFMKRFYGHLKAGQRLDEALRSAQRDLIRSREMSHPFRWAAFQLSGDWW